MELDDDIPSFLHGIPAGKKAAVGRSTELDETVAPFVGQPDVLHFADWTESADHFIERDRQAFSGHVPQALATPVTIDVRLEDRQVKTVASQELLGSLDPTQRRLISHLPYFSSSTSPTNQKH